MELGRPLGVVPAGLGARDTLRLEAGMPLYGHELSEQINPFQAGLGFACHLVGYNFPGRDALLRIQKQPPKSVRIGLGDVRQAGRAARLPDPGRPAEGRRSHQRQLFAHARQSDRDGLRRSRVLPARAWNLHIDIRGSHEPARVVELPFYQSQEERKPEIMSQKLLYSKTHEWVRVENDPAGGKTATVGLTAFALEMLTDLVHIELPKVGRKVKAGQPFGEIESVKAVSDLYSPVDGEVVAVNTALADNLEHLADDPYQSRLVHQDQDRQRSRLGRTARRSGL